MNCRKQFIDNATSALISIWRVRLKNESQGFNAMTFTAIFYLQCDQSDDKLNCISLSSVYPSYANPGCICI